MQASGNLEKISKSTLPLLCFRDGSPPLPDSSNKALNHLGEIHCDNLVMNLVLLVKFASLLVIVELRGTVRLCILYIVKM